MGLGSLDNILYSTDFHSLPFYIRRNQEHQDSVFKHVVPLVCFLDSQGFELLALETGDQNALATQGHHGEVFFFFFPVLLKELDHGFIHVFKGFPSIWPMSNSCGSHYSWGETNAYLHVFIYKYTLYFFYLYICFLVMRGREGPSTDSSPHRWSGRGPGNGAEDDLLRMAYLNAPW